MFWADKLLKSRTGKEIVNDSWTPSGIIHMGSLKGPIIHDSLFRILKEKSLPAGRQGADVKFMYGFDDFDPIDGLPADLADSHSKYLGVPIYIAPSPDGEGSFGDYFGGKMKKLLDMLGIEAEIYRTSQLYREGKFDSAIKFVLDHAQGVRDVYGSVYKKDMGADWFPLQVVCPNCGKVGTTKVTEWNGETVSFSCEPELVKWVKGCSSSGKISPFGGNAKMPWKVEWAAKWWTFGVTVEGAGKDHASAGGSYDVALRLARDVFKIQTPLQFGYEFFLIHGKKMSSSKGLGLTGEELLEVLTPQVARFLMIKTRPEQAVEFDPASPDIIPRIYDDYQKGSIVQDGDDLRRAFDLSQIGEVEKPPKVRFSVLAQWVQMPNMEEEIKKEGTQRWAAYAKVWVEKYAPESEKFLVQKEVPEAARNLNNEQKEYLKKVSELVSESLSAEDFQTKIYDLAKEMKIPTKDAFAAIYLALLGKDHGPKAAWLISSLDLDFVKKRFNEVSGNGNETKKGISKVQAFHNSDIFYIDKKMTDKYPSIAIGIAVIRGVEINKSNPELEKKKEELLKSLSTLTTEEIGLFPATISYRKLYKETGIDWHSRRPSPEALLRRVALKKGLYSVNTCVDAYNLVVMQNKISAGAFDLDKIEFPTVLRFAKAGEKIHLLGDEEETEYKDGEIAYFDNLGGINMDFNYRDSVRTAVQLETKNLYINVDGVFDITPGMVEKTLREVCDNIIQYCGGILEDFGVVTVS